MKKRRIRMMGLVLALLITAGLATSAMAANASSNGRAAKNGIMLGKQYAQSALKAVSELTGLSITDIQAKRQEGQSLANIAASKGVNEQTIINKVMSERKAALDELKAQNKITDTQYQSCITNMESRIKANIERTTLGPANGNAGLRKGGLNNNHVNCPYNSVNSN